MSTLELAHYVAAARPEDLPGLVQAEAVRTVLNWAGCTVGGGQHGAVAAAAAALLPFAGPAQATLLGRAERTDVLHAALLNGIASHVFDFDDTHETTLIHPGGAIVSAAAALAEHRRCSGAAMLCAVVLGVEVACRVGRSVLPDHYRRGWHITGTAGAIGAAVAAGKLLGLDGERMAWAIGIAATQPVGLREMFGSMTKSFHPGRAAQNGLVAALLAEQGFSSSVQAIEAKRGWAAATSADFDPDVLLAGLGQRFEIMGNTYKPYACGLVVHPVIDACLTLREQADDIRSVLLHVHPIVLELTGKTAPATGLDGKFSVYHAAAVALMFGRAGEREFSDAAVVQTADLRGRITAEVDVELAQDAAQVEIGLADGSMLRASVAHATGSLDRPMSDAQMDAKVLGLTEPILGRGRTGALLHACRKLPDAVDAGATFRLASCGSSAAGTVNLSR